MSENRLMTVRDFCASHSWPPEGGLRHLVFFAAENGADAFIRRVGRRVLIDEAAFFSWVDAQKDTPKSGVMVQPRVNRR